MNQENKVTKIIPLYDRVIVRRLPAEEKTSGGVILPESAKEKPMEGQIIAAGKGRLQDDNKILPLSVKVGDCVLFGKWSGTEITLDGEEFLVMHEKDIIGIINK